MGLLTSLREELPAARPIITEGSGDIPPQERLWGSLELVTRAVGLIPNTAAAFPSRDAWRDVGYAIKAALPDHPAEALDLFLDWSVCTDWTDAKGRGNDLAYVEAEWWRFKPPFKRGAGWLYELAEAAAPGRFSVAEKYFVAPGDLGVEFVGDNLVTLFGPPPAARAGLVLVPLRDAAASALAHSTKPLIKGLLDQGAMTVLYGASNTGKTFVAMDIAFHIAAGLPWVGMKTARRAVVYVAAEGGVGARKRAAALERRFGRECEGVEFFYVLAPVDLLKADADLRPLIAAIEALGVEVGLVVIDTLSRAMAGGDENSSTDMGALVRHFDAIRSALGCHLLCVHHSGKDQARGARGHSLLRAATDTELEIADGVIAVTKQRDLDGAFSTPFVLDPVVLGLDEDGLPVTSCTVRIGVRPPVTGEPAGREGDVLHAVSALQALLPDPSSGVPAADIRAFMAARPEPMKDESVRTCIRRLAEKGLLKLIKRGKWSDPNGFPNGSENSVFS